MNESMTVLIVASGGVRRDRGRGSIGGVSYVAGSTESMTGACVCAMTERVTRREMMTPK